MYLSWVMDQGGPRRQTPRDPSGHAVTMMVVAWPELRAAPRDRRQGFSRQSRRRLPVVRVVAQALTRKVRRLLGLVYLAGDTRPTANHAGGILGNNPRPYSGVILAHAAIVEPDLSAVKLIGIEIPCPTT